MSSRIISVDAPRRPAGAQAFSLDARSSRNANLNVYSGPDAARDFIDPDKRPYTSLVELRDPRLNPFLADSVRIFAKLMYESPCLSIKSLPALQILRSAERRGELRGKRKVVENSSGNFALALAGIARVFGLQDIESFVPADIASGKEAALSIAGVRYTKVNGAGRQPDGIERARLAGKNHGVFCPQQYHNEANPLAHEKWTAAQIWRQTQGRITVFCSTLGTSGTVLGARRFFRRQSAPVSLVGALTAPGDVIPGARTLAALKPIGLDWQTAIDYQYEVTSHEAYKLSLELIRATVMAGPSSGAALAAAHQFLAEKRGNGQLDQFRNKHGSVVLVFICSDTFFPYLDRYAARLKAADFV